MRDENKNAEGISKAINFNHRVICMKYFKEFRHKIRASRHIRVFLKFKELRRIRFLKMLTFLYLKQEFVICKHIKSLKVAKDTQIAMLALRSLQLNLNMNRSLRRINNRRAYHKAASVFHLLRLNVGNQQRYKIKENHSQQLRKLLLENRVMQAFKFNHNLYSMQMTQEQGWVVYSHRLRRYLLMFKYVVLQLLPLQRLQTQRALRFHRNQLLKWSYKNTFKNLIIRKHRLQQ